MIAQIAERFAVRKASVMRWLKRIERKPDLEGLKQDLRDYPDAYQRERAERLGVTQNAICYALKHKLRVSYKKNTRASARGRNRTVCLSSPTGSGRSGRAAVGVD